MLFILLTKAGGVSRQKTELQ